jgi:GTP-binding protein
LEFLKHVERCAVLVHVLDCANVEPGRDPLADLDAIEAELLSYGGLADRPRLVALNKVDIPDGRAMAELVRPELARRGYDAYDISAVTHEGLRPLSFAMGRHVLQARAVAAEQVLPRVVIRPAPVDDPGFTVTVETDGYRVRGQRPERWVRQTDFANDEAVGYLADRLARLGVEEQLIERGAQPGATVMIGDGDEAVVFDWQPVVGEQISGPRGSDDRLYVDPESIEPLSPEAKR